ncbi:uncharacterized protein LOC135820163 [Sycon ciliatum]|uniref:uncharacterized protein LOC135820163 n=1 Tax=Sycon ciliatum TaxID=27933 RepID=UPI0031F6221D
MSKVNMLHVTLSLLLFITMLVDANTGRQVSNSNSGGGTWRTCSGGIDLLVAVNARETWTEAEEHCQQVGGHLAVVDPTTVGAACLTDIVALGDTKAHFGITASLDESFRSLPDYNSQSSQLRFSIFGDRCAAVSVTSTGARTISMTKCNGEPRLPYICQRKAGTAQIDVSLACNNKEYIYHSIAFSRQHAADSCERLSTGGRLADTTQSDINCVQRLLNSQPLVSRGLGAIEVFTKQVSSSIRGTRCGYLRASTKAVTYRTCQQTKPVVCERDPLGGGTWRTCLGGIDLLVAVNARETWTEAEEHCQQAGGHLAIADPATVGAACLAAVRELDGAQAHFGITASLDDSFRSLPDYNSRSSLLQFGRFGPRCAAVSVSSDGLRTIRPNSCSGEPRQPFICQRHTALAQRTVSVTCKNKEYIYHPIAFSRQHAADTCERLYTGSQLPDTTQSDINCMQRLLTSQPLVSRGLGAIEVFTKQVSSSFRGIRCGYLRASTKAVTYRTCQQTKPVVCERDSLDPPSTTAQQPPSTAQQPSSAVQQVASQQMETNKEANNTSTAHTDSRLTQRPTAAIAVTLPDVSQAQGNMSSVLVNHGELGETGSGAGQFTPCTWLLAPSILAVLAL